MLEHSLIGAITFFNQSKGEQRCIHSPFPKGDGHYKDRSSARMLKLSLIQYLNAILMSLKLIYQIKATQGITGLISSESSNFQKNLAPRCRLE